MKKRAFAPSKSECATIAPKHRRLFLGGNKRSWYTERMSSLLTAETVAERLRVHPETVLKWLREGRMQGVRLGNRWRVRESQLEAFIESCESVEAGA